MALTINAKTYNQDSFLTKDSVSYVGTLKTVSVKDDVILSREAPKATSAFSGKGRTTAKLTRTLALTGALTTSSDAIVSVSVSVPVGFAGADVDSLLNDFGSFLASASFKTHVKNQQILY